MGNIFGRGGPAINRENQPWLPEGIGFDEEGKPIERMAFANAPDKNDVFTYPANYVSTAKYTVLTFLPVNLFEQFQRLANAYFLFLLILQCIPAISSLKPITTAVPLFFVLVMSAVKDGYDDFKRHQSDKTVNNREVEVFRDGKWVLVNWEDVKVGDMVRVEKDDPICADLVLLTSSEPKGECYVDTAELDGETNLKLRQSNKEVRNMLTDDEELAEFKGYVVCEPPNTELHTFTGKLCANDSAHPLDNDAILLRGMSLRNTGWAVGLVIFAGHDTKLMMNASGARFKRTQVDDMMNRMIIYIFGMLCIISLISGIGSGVWSAQLMPGFQYYLPYETTDNPVAIGILSFFSFIILYNTLVPISLYVSVELIRLFLSWMIDDDLDMYHEESDTPARARTTTLNEELGQIQYIFSDKTGTLTQNIMSFMKCTIGGKLYAKGMTDVEKNQNPDVTPPEPVDFSKNKYYDPDFKFYDDSLAADAERGDENVAFFMRILALCHSAQPEVLPNGNLKYNSQSPDETALVQAAKNFGFVFKERTQESLTLEVEGKEEVYQLLNLLDFTSDRKRMTVVLRFPDGKIRALMKGADTMVMARINKDDGIEAVTNHHLEEFASDGLRTLCLAFKDMGDSEWEDWNKIYQKAQLDLNNREGETAKAAELLERDFTLCGATAIEDKLQLGVPSCIANLRKGGLKIWVLTGDKQETAINIGFACQLLSNDMQIFIVNERTKTDVLDKLQALKDQVDTSLNPVEKALVIDGGSLTFALEEECRLELLDVATECKSVICCRVSPIQKAEVVKLVKDNKDAATLAIGDGANDVSMIQAAHIGVGISGFEGRQAVLASDYSIAQFRYLEKLLLVHGRWSYVRMSRFIRYFFYKNFAFTFCQFWYQWCCGFSAQSVFQSWQVSLYNVVFTAFPVLALGILEQDVGKRYSLAYPELYVAGQQSAYFNTKTFAVSLVIGVFHSIVIFWACILTFGEQAIRSNGWTGGWEMISNSMSWTVLLVVTLAIAMATNRWTVFHHCFIWGSLIAWWIFVFYMYGLPMMIWEFEDFYGIMPNMLATPLFWWYSFLATVMCLAPCYVYLYAQQQMYPTPTDIVREIAYLNRQARKKGLVKDEFSSESHIVDTASTAPAQSTPPRNRTSLSKWAAENESQEIPMEDIDRDVAKEPSWRS